MGHPTIRRYTVREGLLSDVVLSLAAAKDGSLWVGGPDGLNRIRGARVDGFTSADGLPDDFVRSLLADSDGSLWIGTRRGLAHWKRPGVLGAGQIEILTTANGLGSDLVGAMARDGKGDLWVATFAGLSRLHGGRVTNYTTADGLTSNVITAMEVRANGMLLVGTQDRGWNVWDGRGFKAAAHDGLERTTIRAVLEDGANHLWFATGNGIARCDCDMQPYRRSTATPTKDRMSPYRTFDMIRSYGRPHRFSTASGAVAGAVAGAGARQSTPRHHNPVHSGRTIPPAASLRAPRGSLPKKNAVRSLASSQVGKR